MGREYKCLIGAFPKTQKLFFLLQTLFFSIESSSIHTHPNWTGFLREELLAPMRSWEMFDNQLPEEKKTHQKPWFVAFADFNGV